MPHFQAFRGGKQPRFANRAELECAKLLDYYGVPWDYEPTTFVLERAADGSVVEAFRPDFYLPQQDLYLELTVMKQSLVTRKNRKLRRLRQLYPDIRIKLFYARDFRALMLKFGRLALVEELSGTSGHLSPDRAIAADELPAIEGLTTKVLDKTDSPGGGA